MMERRAFLSALVAGLGGAAAHTLDLDRLLWVPGRKRIFFPPAVPSWVPGVTLMRGEVFTMAGHYVMNPQGVSTGVLRQFVVIGDSRL